MQDPAKYVIRARITASGVVERSDVVGAIFGQTEGLLGEALELRALQEAERVGRIQVEIESSQGTSEGEIAIATDMDRVETAVLAAALETIERVGPCRAEIGVIAIEDVRAAKRRNIVDRARELLAGGFEDVGLAGRDLVTAVREEIGVAEIAEFAGYPAGPDVATSEEIIVVEGRADVLRLLDYGITNVVGVEGTDVPAEIADLTRERTVTAFFDGDRGGDLLLLELAQIGDVDYVTFAPPGRAVEDLTLPEIDTALAEKVPYEDAPEPVESAADDVAADDEPAFREHVEETIVEGTGELRVLGPDWAMLEAADVDELADVLARTDGPIGAVVIDGTVGQREADVAARNEVPLLIGRERGEFTKRPVDVRVLTADRVLDRAEQPGSPTK